MNSHETTLTGNGKVLPDLNRLITELISTQIGISPEKVTTEFIHIWRERELYPTAPIEMYVNGYGGGGRTALTRQEVIAQSDSAKAFFVNIANGKKLD